MRFLEAQDFIYAYLKVFEDITKNILVSGKAGDAKILHPGGIDFLPIQLNFLNKVYTLFRTTVRTTLAALFFLEKQRVLAFIV